MITAPHHYILNRTNHSHPPTYRKFTKMDFQNERSIHTSSFGEHVNVRSMSREILWAASTVSVVASCANRCFAVDGLSDMEIWCVFKQ